MSSGNKYFDRWDSGLSLPYSALNYAKVKRVSCPSSLIESVHSDALQFLIGLSRPCKAHGAG
jgi:hypothetical protein